MLFRWTWLMLHSFYWQYLVVEDFSGNTNVEEWDLGIGKSVFLIIEIYIDDFTKWNTNTNI
jgi:hypothetical protein